MSLALSATTARRGKVRAISFVLVGAALFSWRAAFPERSLEAIGWRALSDAGFALGLLAFVLLLAWAVGRGISERLSLLDDPEDALVIVFQVSLGLGFLGVAILLLGLFGLFSPLAFLALVFATALASRRALSPVLQALAKLPGRVLRAAKGAGPLGLTAVLTSALIGALATLQALTPPWDYDGLMYHLQAPRLYLEAGRVFLTPDLWQANGPMLGEMLYGLGLAFGSDTFARLLHLSLAFLLAISAAGLAARHLGTRGGWITLAVLVGIPIYPMWGQLAFADMFWALYEWLAICAMLHWASSAGRRWLYLAGTFLGLALGSKYLALGLAPLLLLWILLLDLRKGARVVIADGLALLIPAAALSAAWFLKNWAWTGNPIYPFALGGPSWDETRLNTLMAYLRSFGTGHQWKDYLLLPWSIYAQHVRFGTFMTTIELPSLLFPLALLFPIASHPRGLRPLTWLALGRLALWAAGSQQIRFLLPIFPLAAVLTAAVLDRGWRSLEGRVGLRILVPSLLIGALASTLAYQVIFLRNTRPLPVVLGTEDKDSFLQRAVYDYPALRFVRQALPHESRVAMLWDGQGYYCDQRCWPDADQSRWVQLVEAEGDGETALERLADDGFAYVLVDYEGASFLLTHDPEERHSRAFELLLQAIAARRLESAFVSEKVTVYRILAEPQAATLSPPVVVRPSTAGGW